ncbi:MAG TPA: GDSL-type esterase/lipase family protein [Verrucomicrobiae bacterium]|nr:GDSL-type esterase/lipase family protein [Verrucomicrobiae bacterium]
MGLGASATAGTPGFFSPRERPPAGEGNEQSQYAYWMMKARPGWEVLNRGMRGQRTDQILLRFDYDVLDNHPDVVIIMAGTNDLYQGHEPAEAMANLDAMYEKARGAGIRVIACSIIPLNLASAEIKKKIVELNRLVGARARESGLVFADVYKIMEDPARPGFIAVSPDEVHPDVNGYRRMGEALVKAVEFLGNP